MKIVNYPAKPWYSEYYFDSIDDFRKWSASIPIENGGTPLHGMVFRGVGRANTYKLIPSAFRKRKFRDGKMSVEIVRYHPSYDEKLFDGNDLNTAGIIKAEISELQKFYKEANSNGLAVPNIPYFKEHLYSVYHRGLIESLSLWPDPSMLELIALAQHYGLPTRLLDWTSDFNIALFFALRSIVNEINELVPDCEGHHANSITEPFAVWAVKPQYIQGFYEEYADAACPIKFFVPIYANNPNLKAQAGLLSYEISSLCASVNNAPFFCKPMNEVLDDYYFELNKKGNISHDGVQLCKMVFNSNNPLLDFKYLSEHGYNSARLFPGYNGVVKKIEEDQMINRLTSFLH